MALCVYHETTEAVATCPVCKQGICAKCLEFGEDGMCGMCVEIASARKATQQANRAAATAAAAARPAAQAPTPPANGKPAGSGNLPPAKAGTGPKPGSGSLPPGQRPAGRPPAPQAAKGGPSGNLPPAPAKPAAKPGMCPEHPDQAAKVACTHCNKRVCPYCLDLYDLCADCRQLPQCARHESMVGAQKCAECKMNYCKICLDGTEYCDRCRTLRQAAGKPVRSPSKPGPAPAAKGGSGAVKSPTQSLARTPTGALNKGEAAKSAPGGAPPPKTPAAPAAKAPSGKFQRGAAAAALQKKAGGPPWPLIGGVAVVVLIAAWRVFGGKPALPPEEAVAALRQEMKLVQKAAVGVASKNNGAFPTTSAAILDELKAEGVEVDQLPLPLKLSVGTPVAEALAISYMRVGESFEIRALDAEGRPLADNGRDVVLRPPSGEEQQEGQPRRNRPEAPSPSPSE